MSCHLHVISSVKLSLTVNWESSKNLILLNSASFFKNLTCFNASIMLCKAELTCWHHTAIHALQSRALLTSYCHLMFCFACWHHTAISCSALCQAELTHWHHTIILHSALLTNIILLSHTLFSVKQSWLADIILSSCALVLCSVCWHHTVKYLCFTAELVVKKYKKISFADQMLRSTKIKWARKRKNTDSA